MRGVEGRGGEGRERGDAGSQFVVALLRDPQLASSSPLLPPAAALKLVGESYAWERGAGSTFLYLRDNHTSVLGIRQLATAQGAACTAAVQLAQSPAPQRQQQPKGGGAGWVVEPCGGPEAAQSLEAAASSAAAAAGDAVPPLAPTEHLFAMPVESNFSGVRYDLGLVEAVQQGRLQYKGAAGAGGRDPDGSSSSCSGDGGLRALPAGRWRVLLDAAKACGSSPPDLGAHPADFVALSYYKVRVGCVAWCAGSGVGWVGGGCSSVCS